MDCSADIGFANDYFAGSIGSRLELPSTYDFFFSNIVMQSHLFHIAILPSTYSSSIVITRQNIGNSYASNKNCSVKVIVTILLFADIVLYCVL